VQFFIMMVKTKEIAERIQNLAKKSPKLTHEYRFLAGAVYALGEAEKLNHKNRSDHRDPRQHVDELEEVLDLIGKGMPPTKQWLAGFYYNGAIMRIDAIYDRLKKVVPKNVKSISGDALELVRGEVKALKHTIFGWTAVRSRQQGKTSAIAREDIAKACSALQEVLEFLEDRKVLEHLKVKYSSHPKP